MEHLRHGTKVVAPDRYKHEIHAANDGFPSHEQAPAGAPRRGPMPVDGAFPKSRRNAPSWPSFRGADIA